MTTSFAGVRVLFLCVANAARSPMAAALAQRALHAEVRPSSAGIRPSDQAHPYAIEVMREVGVDLTGHVPRSVDDVALDEVDLVITLCEEDVRPSWLREKPWIRLKISDPALHAMEFSRAMALEGFRSAREDIEEGLLDLARRGLPR